MHDAASLRNAHLPVWTRNVSPRNALFRLQTAEINGPIQLGGSLIEPGNLVTADDNGVVVVSHSLVGSVLNICEVQEAIEARQRVATK